MATEHRVTVRVRYGETDQMGVVYHPNYFLYFETGRTELMRAAGVVYSEMEKSGVFLVVTQASCRYRAAARYDRALAAGADANIAKLLASEAAWKAADTCVQTHGGFGFAEEYDVERKFRETRLYQVAPISTNLILSYVAEHVLGMPRSY